MSAGGVTSLLAAGFGWKPAHGLFPFANGSVGAPGLPPISVAIGCGRSTSAPKGSAALRRPPSSPRSTVPPTPVSGAAPAIETVTTPSSAARLSGTRPRHTTAAVPRSVSIQSVSAASAISSPARPPAVIRATGEIPGSCVSSLGCSGWRCSSTMRASGSIAAAC